jgi:hypothetical protein
MACVRIWMLMFLVRRLRLLVVYGATSPSRELGGLDCGTECRQENEVGALITASSNRLHKLSFEG